MTYQDTRSGGSKGESAESGPDLRESNKRPVMVVILAIFAFLLACVVIESRFLLREVEESENAAIRAMAQSAREAVNQIETLDKGGKAGAQQAPVVPDSRSALGRAAPHVQAMLAEYVKLYAELRTFEEKSGVDNILEARSLGTIVGRERARITFDNYVAELTHHEERRRVVGLKHRALIAEAVGKGPGGVAILNGLDKHFARNSALQQESIANHREIRDAVYELTRYLDGVTPRPKVHDDQFIFAEQAQVDRYQVLLKAVGEAARKEEALAERVQKIQKDGVEGLERAADEGVKGKT